MRRKILAGNWKMNKSYKDAIQLTESIVTSDFDETIQLIVIPPSVYVSELSKITSSTRVELGLQNSSQYDLGAYTGEISASMIKSVGAQYAIVGHSERRQYFNEQNDVLALKINQLLSNDLTPIYCCGEVFEDRKNEVHFSVVESQIEEGLFHLNEAQILKCIIAYEPVWAIGTGVTATSTQAQEMHLFIRKLIIEKFGKDIANEISILYGGSCNPSNSKELFANPDVDGGLIGGASLIAEDFIALANSF